MRNSIPITIFGNLTDAPELRFTASGAAVAAFTVGVNPRVYDKIKGEWVDGEPSFYRCTAWRQLAENIAESLPKGARVVVAGTIAQRRWEKDGEKHSTFEVTAEVVGAELTYAQVTIKKMARGSRDEIPPDDAWATASRTPVPAGAGASDEPPF